MKKHTRLTTAIRKGQHNGSSHLYLLFRDVKLAPDDLRHPQATFGSRQHSSETVKCLTGQQDMDKKLTYMTEKKKILVFSSLHVEDVWNFQHAHGPLGRHVVPWSQRRCQSCHKCDRTTSADPCENTVVSHQGRAEEEERWGQYMLKELSFNKWFFHAYLHKSTFQMCNRNTFLNHCGENRLSQNQFTGQ